ncbi:hypothetical protein C8R46DRAFT_1283969 [Mycena filopes]|nr:hypothetical protein C8R46DRAFT_1283969 [Mycena filopes]
MPDIDDDERPEVPEPQVLHPPAKRIRSKTSKKASKHPAASASTVDPVIVPSPSPSIAPSLSHPPSPSFLPADYDAVMDEFLPDMSGDYLLPSVGGGYDLATSASDGGAQNSLGLLPYTQTADDDSSGTHGGVVPRPRPIYVGAPFEAERVVGGSPGRASRGTMEVNGYRFPTSGAGFPAPTASFPPPSGLFQAFSRPAGARSSTPFTFGAGSSSDFVLHASTNTSNDAWAGLARGGVSLPSLPSTESSVSLNPKSVPAQKPSALQTFSSALANASSAVPPPQAPRPPRPTPPAVPPPPAIVPTPTAASGAPIPQYIQSRPMANVPTGHRLAPATARRGRGRPSKTPTAPDANNAPSVSAPLPDPPSPAITGDEIDASAPSRTMTAAARAETNRINAEARTLGKQKAVIRGRLGEKELDERNSAATETARRTSARHHNPDGHHDLFITSPVPRSKRTNTNFVNPDGTSRRNTERKRTRAEIAREKEELALAEQLRNGKRKAPARNAASGPSKKKRQ